MSANVNIPSNEEIIEELTSDLNKVDLDKSNPTFSPEGEPLIDQETEADELNDEEDNESSQDYIDEEALKDLEVTLSEEEKEKRRKDSEDDKNKGNELFKSGQYLESCEKYTNGLRTCPLLFSKDRAILYSNRAAAKIKLDLKECALSDCSKAIELDPNYIRALQRRAQVCEQLEKFDEALCDYKKILELDPKHNEANIGVLRLPPLIEERNEKLKTEMMGKLKDLGNLILRPFGLSTNNFELNQNSETGGYSINFKQNQ